MWNLVNLSPEISKEFSSFLFPVFFVVIVVVIIMIIIIIVTHWFFVSENDKKMFILNLGSI